MIPREKVDGKRGIIIFAYETWLSRKSVSEIYSTRVYISISVFSFFFCFLSLLIIYYTFYQYSFSVIFDLDDFVNKYVSLKTNLKNFFNKNYWRYQTPYCAQLCLLSYTTPVAYYLYLLILVK